jgi:hypothetical protein
VRRIALPAALIVVLAGCGSHDAAGGWRARAEAVCKDAVAAIRERGWPLDLRELQTTGPDAANDMRTAIRRVRRLPLDRGAHDARAFVDGLRGLEPVLDDVTQASVAMDVQRLPVAARRLEEALWSLEASARRAGLGRCFGTMRPAWAADGIRAPVFAQEAESLTAALARLLPRFTGPGRTRLIRISGTLRFYSGALGRLTPPAWARDETDSYLAALGRLQRAAVRLASRARVPPSDPRIRAFADEVDRRGRALRRSLKAAPVTRAPEPDAEQES